MRRKVYESCILPFETYRNDVAHTESAERLRVPQRAMERAVIGISLKDQKLLRVKTRVTDIIERVAQLKWRMGKSHSKCLNEMDTQTVVMGAPVNTKTKHWNTPEMMAGRCK